MTKKKPPETDTVPEAYDPFQIRSLEQILTLFDGGDFLANFLAENRDLLRALQDHNDQFGHKSAKGSFTLSVNYSLSVSGDLTMQAQREFKTPKAPPSQAGAYVTEQGEMTLYSPLMKRMHGGVRDVTPHDPETGEVRDV